MSALWRANPLSKISSAVQNDQEVLLDRSGGGGSRSTLFDVILRQTKELWSLVASVLFEGVMETESWNQPAHHSLRSR